MNKELNKAIYARTRLKNSFSKNPIKDNECLLKNKETNGVTLRRKSIKKCFANISKQRIVTKNYYKNYCKVIKPFFTNKGHINETLCLIWYHLYNLKNVKKSHGGVLLLACNFTKSNTPPWVFSRFLNCTNSTKSRNASQIVVTL